MRLRRDRNGLFRVAALGPSMRWEDLVRSPEAAQLYDKIWAAHLDVIDLDGRVAEEIADLGEEATKDLYETDFYSDLAELLAIDGHDCWRAISSPDIIDPSLVESIGVYWSRNPDSAQPYWGADNDLVYTFRARANAEGLLLEEALLALRINPDEDEITFREGTALFVYECELPPEIDYDDTIDVSLWTEKGVLVERKDSEWVVPIKDWRRT